MAFRTQKISQMTPKGSDLEATDLLEVSTIESGSYVTRSITGQEIIDAAVGNVDWGDIGGTLSDQTDLNTALSGKVPTTRTLTINGTTQDLSADRTFTISTGITIGTTAITSGTVGRVLFEGTGNVVQESANLFWDNTNGRLGIGTASPLATLHLNTTTAVYNCRIQSQSASGANLIGAEYYWDSTQLATFSVNGPSGEFKWFLKSGYFATFYSNALERMRIFTTGNIGINTTTDAGFKLDVNGTARTSQLHTFLQGTYLDATSTNYFHSADTGNSTYGGLALRNSTQNYTGYIQTGRSGSANGINFYHTTFAGGTVGDTQQKFTASAVTFGRPNTGNTLNVFASGGSNGVAQYPIIATNLVNTTNTGVGYLFQSADSVGAGTINHASVVAFKSNGVAPSITSSLRFFTISDAANTLSEKMRIADSGNVLINTTTDAGFKLDVNGTARIKGAGSTTATNAFNVINSSNVELFKINDLGDTTIGNNRYLKAFRWTNDDVTRPLQIEGNSNFNVDGLNIISFNNALLNNTKNLVNIGLASTVSTQSSGSTDFFNSVYIQTAYNFTGGTHTVKGIYYNPTLTSMVNTTHHAFHSTSGRIRFENLPTSSAGLSAGDIWNDAGTLKIV